MNLANLLTNMNFQFSINIMYIEDAALLYNELNDANLNLIQVYLFESRQWY